MILWQRLQGLIQSAGIELVGCNLDHALIYISIDQQLLSLVSPDSKPLQSYPVSTSRYGPGQQVNSYKTPLGIHKIERKIGQGEALGRVFRARVATDELSYAEDYQGEQDIISSRILWLKGLQSGWNAGGEVDTFDRYIYIHGTPDEAHIGQAASQGCIRMTNHHVIELFDLVAVNDVVIIE
jgi:hypothetical protein